MSSRKSSLKLHPNPFDPKQPQIQQSRHRKNSLGTTTTTANPKQPLMPSLIPTLTPALAQLHSNLNLTLTLDQKAAAKLMFVKKLERLEKEAIKCFYQQRVEECFGGLEKCLDLLESPWNGGGKGYGQGHSGEDGYFLEHLVYVRYLQSEFNYKLKQYKKSRQFHEKAQKILPKLSSAQHLKTKQYQFSLQSLHACLLYQQQKYTECIQNIEQLQTKINEGRCRLNQKTVKQLSMCRIQALMELGEGELVVRLVGKFLGEWGSGLGGKERVKVGVLLAMAYKNMGDIQQAQHVILQLINYFTSQPQSPQSHQYLPKCYETYLQLHQNSPLKSLQICRQWQQQTSHPDEPTSKLFHLYFQIGDYEQALVQYSELSEDYKRSSQDWGCLGEIKEFYGEIEVAEHMFMRALELAKCQERKMEIQVKLLGFVGEADRKEAMRNVERKIKANRGKAWIGRIVEMYGEYLQMAGQSGRLDKIMSIIGASCTQTPNQLQSHPKEQTKLVDEFMQTGKFCTLNQKQKPQKPNSPPRSRRNSIATMLIDRIL